MKPRLTDDKILDLLQRGEIQVSISEHGIQVHKRHHGNGRNGELQPLKQYSDDPNRLCLKIRVSGYPIRKIFRNKLVWMWAKNRTVPVGYNVDHIDNNSLNDHPDNLRLTTKSESNREGCDRQHWDDVAGFFDYIAFTGQEPSIELWP